jgi:hypothetical protein
MAELFSSLTDQPTWLIAAMLVLLYFVVVGCVWVFLRPAIVNYLDPLNIRLLLFIGPALIGFIVAPYWTGSFSGSYFLILLFIGLWFLTMRASGRPTKIDLKDRMSVGFQYALLSLVALIIVSNVVVNMLIPGKIPLLTEGGMLSRFDATDNSRILTWLAFGVAPMAGMMFAVTESTRVRKLALCAMILQIAEDLLFASKAGILTIVFVLINAMFIAKARGEVNRYKSIRCALIWSSAIVALVVPFYLSFIMASGSLPVLASLVVRFLGGFDQLIFTAQFDLLRHNGFPPVLKSNIAEYQLMPFFKGLFSTKYEYSSVGQYVVAAATGQYIEGPYTFPNSNLILETVFTSGKYIGSMLFVLELACFYRCRVAVLRRPITPLSLVLVLTTVLEPTGLFSSGQEWATETLLIVFIVIAAMALAKLCQTLLGIMRHLPTAAKLAGNA